MLSWSGASFQIFLGGGGDSLASEASLITGGGGGDVSPLEKNF